MAITWHKGYGPDEGDKELGGPGYWYAMRDGEKAARAEVHESTPAGYWGRYRLWVHVPGGKPAKHYPSTLRECKEIVARAFGQGPELKIVAKSAGQQTIDCGGHRYELYRFSSDYGDMQWMIDRDDTPCLFQADTLPVAHATIRSDASEATR